MRAVRAAAGGLGRGGATQGREEQGLLPVHIHTVATVGVTSLGQNPEKGILD